MVDSADMLNLLTSSRSASRIIARRGAQAVSYGEFLQRVKAWRALLRRGGGSAFALYIEDSVEFASALFGAWQADKLVYLPGDNLPGTCAGLRSTVDGFLGQFDAQWSPLAPAIQECEGEGDFKNLYGACAGLVLYTSGTTGAAQGIAKNLGQMAREVATLEAQFGRALGSAEIVSTVSHQHIYGLLFRVLWPLAAGRVFHARSYAYFEELRPVLATRESALVSSPAHLKRLPEHPGWAEAGRQLRAVFSSGGPLSLEVAQETNRLLGSVPIEVYGSSETGGIAWRQQWLENNAAWLPFSGVDWRIEPQEGVLEVRSPNLPDDNWFRMADRVQAAADGQFLLSGRIDKIVKIEGKRISLSAIERQFMASSLVVDARAVVVNDRRQRIAAFIVLTAEGRRKLAGIGKLGLNRLLAKSLAPFVEPVGIPRLWRYLEALPVNAQGKTTQAELAALIGSATRQTLLPRERVIGQDGDWATFELVAPRDLVYFNGHFTAAPLLPGVVQLDWVIAYGRRSFDLPPIFLGIQALKFHRIITPEMAFNLELTYERAKFSLVFKITSPAGVHASGRVLFGAADV